MTQHMTEEELAAIEEFARLGDFAGCPGDLLALVAEIRRLRAVIPWCPRGNGDHLLDDTYSGYCSTCGDTVT